MTSDELEATWTTWKSQLAKGTKLSVDPRDFINAMCEFSIASDAVNAAEGNSYFRDALQKTLASSASAMGDRVHDSDLRRVLSSLGHDWIARTLVQSERKKITSMTKRVATIQHLTSLLCDEAGREWVRKRAESWWRVAEFSEEEGDALIKVLLSRDVYRAEDMEHWGPKASDSVSRVTRRAAIDGNLRWTMEDPSRVSMVGHSTTANWLRERTSLLQQRLLIPVDLKDSGFQKTELDRLTKPRQLDSVPWLFWERALERRLGMPLRMLFREFPELALAAFSQKASDSSATNATPAMHVPLLRLMHMRLLLESPSLSDSLAQPELSMIPDVIMYLLGRDYVSYSPELRVFDSCERRWRARWVETTAEAMSSLLLEDLLRFDLTTLSRIPETKEPTPDFLGSTESEEPIVFECKGATGWKTHRDQRNEALAQLGKGHKSNRVSHNSWAGEGRAFAMSLFAARQGDSKSSLLHVHDPVFMFDPLFGEGWEDRARRSHFAGVLQTALLFDEADVVLRRGTFETGNKGSFRIDGEDDLTFVGSYLPVDQWARRLRHPDHVSLKQLKVFIGVEQMRYRVLAEGNLPARSRRLDNFTDKSFGMPPDESSPGYVPRLSNRTSTLPSREFPGEPRGIFSVLSNGSFLAIEIGP